MSCPPLRYQSPIELSSKDALSVEQSLCVKGHNNGSTYDPIRKIFQVEDRIILKTNGRRYQLDEYHFHFPGEHHINGKSFPAEVHYVFIELPEGHAYLKADRSCIDVCGHGQGHNHEYHSEENILVIGRVIKPSFKHFNSTLNNLQVKVPSTFFQYDGGLTGDDVSTPVRWIFGKRSIKLALSEIIPIAKTSRPLQPLDGRLILISK